jgi:arginyl-tRNA synthetase
MKLYDLIAMAEVEAKSRLAEQGLGDDYSAEEREAIAEEIAIATIKFAGLSNHRTTDYIFDLERFSKFEGKTGPYLQYAAVRIQSILRKARDEGHGPGVPAVHSPEERTLVLQLLSLDDAMLAAEQKRAPNILCDYAFTLAQNFSRFYAAHHILSESDAGLRGNRLGLCARVLEVLTRTLALLGIAVPERM